LLGATDKEIANFFEVDERTINRWKIDYPVFCQSLKRGKLQADATVAYKLYKRATGFKHTEDKIFVHEGQTITVPTIKTYPPDTTAAIFWLKNRRTSEWRDKHENELNFLRTLVNTDLEALAEILMKRLDEKENTVK
jgi:hypothetical protein